MAASLDSIKEEPNHIIPTKIEPSPDESNSDVDIYEFKIILRSIKPKIWRKIQVPSDYTFREFHVAIQKAMGWQSVVADYHSHEFTVVNPETKTRLSIYSKDNSIDSTCFGRMQDFVRLAKESESVDEHKERINKYFKEPVVDKALYVYDFGDNWNHVIKFERIFKSEPDVQYPKCVAGENACPPEDCGGPMGYKKLLETLEDTKHAEHDEMTQWISTCSPGFKADFFDPNIPFVRPYDIILQFYVSLQGNGVKMTWYNLQVPDYYTMYKLHVSIKKILDLKSTKNACFTTCDVNYEDLKIDIKDKENSPKVYEFFGYLPQYAYYTLDEERSYKIILINTFLPQPGEKYPNCDKSIKFGPVEDCRCDKHEPKTTAEKLFALRRVVKFPKIPKSNVKKEGIMFFSDLMQRH